MKSRSLSRNDGCPTSPHVTGRKPAARTAARASSVSSSAYRRIVTREKPNALLIPADALQGASVFVLDGNRARKREIKIGIRGTRSVEVLSGLSEGESIASPAATDLKDGARVRVAAPPL